MTTKLQSATHTPPAALTLPAPAATSVAASAAPQAAPPQAPIDRLEAAPADPGLTALLDTMRPQTHAGAPEAARIPLHELMGQRDQTMLASAPGVMMLGAAGAPSGPPPLPAEVTDTLARLPQHLDGPDALRHIGRALDAAGLTAGRLKTDAGCALCLKDALNTPRQLRGELASALSRTPAFQRLSDDEKKIVLDKAMSHIETRFTAAVSGLIKADARAQIQGAQRLYEGINASPATRRAALVELARRGPDEAGIRAGLARLGLSERQLNAVAPTLTKLHGELKRGEGESIVRGEAFKSAEGALHHALNGQVHQLEQLNTALGNDHYKHDRLLRSDLFKSAREAVFERLELPVPSPRELQEAERTGQGLPVGSAGVIAAAMTRGQRKDDTEESMILAVNVVSSLISGGVASTGLIGTLITGGLGAIPSVAIPQHTLDKARTAAALALTDEATVIESEAERDIAVAIAAMGVLIDGTLDGVEVAKGGLRNHLKESAEAGVLDVAKTSIQEGTKMGAEESINIKSGR